MPTDQPTQPTTPQRSGLAKDVWPRLASGLVLGATALGLLWWGPLPFALLVMAVCTVMSWEWARVVRGGDSDATLVIHILAVVAACVLAAAGYAALGVLATMICALIVAILRFGEKARLSAIGVAYTCLPAIALLWLRGDATYGFLATLLLLLLVVMTDTGAYFSGRMIGGPKLWPQVSPNKTWSGLAGGAAAAIVTGAVFAVVLLGTAPFRLALTGLVVALVAQAGDMAESALKRGRGVKDASALIPGHGGFMDRMDGVVTAAIAAALFALAVNMHAPARAFLLWS